MPKIDYLQMPRQRIWPGITGAIYHSAQSTIGHIYIEDGTVLPTHHHIHEQWSHVIEGSIEFTLGEEVVLVNAGESVYIPSNLPHSGRALSSCKIIDCFIPPREDWKDLPYE